METGLGGRTEGMGETRDVDGEKMELNQVGTCSDLKKTKHLANTGTHEAATVVEQGSDGVKWKVQCSRF